MDKKLSRIRNFIKNYRKILIGAVICLLIVFSISTTYLFLYNKQEIINTNDTQLKNISEHANQYFSFFDGYVELHFEEETSVVNSIQRMLDISGNSDDLDVISLYLWDFEDGRVCLVDKNRNVVLDNLALFKDIDFKDSKFNDIFKPASNGFNHIEEKGKDWISYPFGDYYLVTEKDNSFLNFSSVRELLASTLDNCWVGAESELAFYSRDKGQIIYCQDASFEGAAVDVKSINSSFVCNVNGKEYIARSYPCDEYNADFIAFTPLGFLINFSLMSVRIEVIVFVILLILLISFIVYLREDELDVDQEFSFMGKYFLLTQVKRFRYLAVFSGILLFVSLNTIINLNVISYTAAYLYDTSNSSVATVKTIQDINEYLVKKNHYKFYQRGRLLNTFLETYNGRLTKPLLQELKKDFDVKDISIFDSRGHTVLSSSPEDHISLLSDKECSLYDLRYVLMGKETMMVHGDPKIMDKSDIIYAVPRRNSEGIADGLIAIITSDGHLESHANLDTSIGSFSLKQINGTMLFACDKDGVITLHPDPKMVGKTVEEYSIKPEELAHGFAGELTYDNERYVTSSVEYDRGFVFLTAPYKWVTPISLLRAFVSLVMFLVLCLWIVYDGLGSKFHFTAREAKVKDADDWKNTEVKWDDLDTNKKFGITLKYMIYVFSIYIIILALWQKNLFMSDIGFSYIVSGDWRAGLSVFSFLGNICMLCVTFSLVGWIQSLLMLIARATGARGETACRLLANIIKYVGAAMAFYYCAINFGLDAPAALASLGIVGVGLSFGAQDLIKDVIAGLFILFEGNYKVGDMLTINGEWFWVKSIGVRTTRVEAWGTVKLINNSQMTSGVSNIQEANAAVDCDVIIGKEYDLLDIEEILDNELPKLKENYPPEVATPSLKGVQEITAQGLKIRIRTYCPVRKRGRTGRALRRDVALIFEKYQIRIPEMAYVISSYAVEKEDIIRDMQEGTRRIKENADEFRNNVDETD